MHCRNSEGRNNLKLTFFEVWNSREPIEKEQKELLFSLDQWIA